jgi:predicted amidohydrolase YtcJ
MSELKGAAIELDVAGEPTGVVREGLMIFPDLRIPPDDLRRYYTQVIPGLWNARGYTSVYTLAPLDQLPVLRELAQSGATTLRYTIGLHADPGGRFLPPSFAGLPLPASVDPVWYRIAGIKVWVDSDVPMRGGAVNEPYAGTAYAP